MCRNILSIICITILISAVAQPQNDGGYVNPMSVSVGDTISFYISTSVDPFSLNVYQIGIADTLKSTYANIPGGIRSLPDSSFIYGCNWPLSFSIVIPSEWNPGIYRATFPDASGSKVKQLTFVVKGKIAGSYFPICVALSENTDNAYNKYGGCSLYGCNNCSACRSYKVSFDRPLSDNSGLGSWGNYPITFYQWLLTKNLSCEFVSQFDIYSNNNLLNNYKVLIITGHSEYWSLPERNNIQHFVNAGGKLIVLSGNTSGYQSRYENNGRTLVCYKDAVLDPFNNLYDSLVTTNWWYPPVNNPESTLLGAGYQYSGYVNLDKMLPFSAGFGDYSVNNSHHWIYKNSGVQNGDLFGRDGSNPLNYTVGYEDDGAFFNYFDGVPFTTGIDGSPLNYRILGISPAANDTTTYNFTKHATMGFYYTANNGSVFNAASINWVIGLNFDSTVQKVTYNVINKALESRLPPDIIQWNPFTLTPKTIHNESVMINSRNVIINQDLTRFSVKAVDPYNGLLNYFWMLDTVIVSSDSFYLFHISGLNRSTYNLTAFVFNSKDTSSISWTVDAHALSVNKSTIAPINFYLYQNYPNPFNPSTNIKYSVKFSSRVLVTIYNIIGENIKKIEIGNKDPGYYDFDFNGSEFSSGVYIYTIEFDPINGENGFRSSRKMILLK